MSASASAELVDYLARRLVEHDDQVKVEEVEEDGALVIRPTSHRTTSAV